MQDDASYNARAEITDIWHTVPGFLPDTAMKRWLTFVLLLLCLPASAQHWVRYAETDQGRMYFDSLRTRKMGDTAFVWDLHDLTSAGTDGSGRAFQSVLYATEYQCRARKSRVLGITRLAGSMGSGPVVGEETLVSDWREAIPDSLGARLFDHICE